MRLPKPSEGVFSNTMPYASWGEGSKNLLVIPGGPSNDPPTASSVKWMGRSLKPLVENDYTMWMVARRRGMPEGHSIEDMAADYAALIADELHGSIELVVGLSLGGAIGIYLAANHPEHFDHIALVGIAHTFSDRGLRLDYDYATALSESRPVEAGRLMAGAMLSESWLRWTAPVLGTLMGMTLRKSREHDLCASDLIVEAEAEMSFDARPDLPRIQVPVQLLAGDRDFYFPIPVIEETARLIPDCTLRVYPEKGHLGAIQSRRLAGDISDFVERESEIAS